MATWWSIPESDIRRLERIAKRLYREDRLSGDEMRDMASELEAIANGALAPAEDALGS